MNLFNLMAKISLDSKEFDDGIGKAEKSGSGFASKMGTFAGGAVKAVGAVSLAVGGAMTAIAGFSMNGAMELEASEAKYNTVFDGFVEQTDGFINKFKELTPLTTAEARNMASGLGDLLIPMGFARDEATNLTGEFMHVIGALTNFNSGTETAESVSAKFAGALTGEYSNLKSLGIQLDATTMKQKLVEKGKGDLTGEALKQAQVEILLEEAYKQSGDALAAYNEESLDAKTKMQLLTKSLADVGAQMGSKFLPILNNTLSGLKEGLSSAIPYIDSATDGLLNMINGVEGGAEQFKTGVNDLLSGLVNALVDMIPMVIDIAFQIILAVTETILESLPLLVQAGMDILYYLGAGIAENLPSLLETVAQTIVDMIDAFLNGATDLIDVGIWIIESLVTGLLQAIPTLLTQAPALIEKFVAVVLENAPKLLITGVDLIQQIISGIIKMLPNLAQQAPILIQNLINAILNELPYILQTGMELVIELALGLIKALPTLITNTVLLITNILTTLSSNLPQILSMGVTLILELGKGLIKAIPSLVSNIPAIVSAIVQGFVSLGSSFLTIGSDIVKGIWSGISSMTSWITGKISGFASGIVSSVKGFFGIHSPSRVFRDEVGTFMAQGIGVGFENEMDSVNADIQKSLDSTVNMNVPQMETEDNGIGQVIRLLQQLLNKDTSIEIDGREVMRATAEYQSEYDEYNSRNPAFA